MENFRKSYQDYLIPNYRMVVAIVFLLSCLVAELSGAQVTTNITPDTTLPTNSVVLPNGNVFNITEGTSVGNNLFHSFQDFNVGAGDTANFVDPGGIANILSRVTGTNVSNIFGQLRSDSSANLFFLNPNGVVFGPNSSLDVGGSFYVSTADYIRLGDGSGAGWFHASDPANDVLTASPPGAFGFLGSNVNSQGIAINGASLSVPTGNSLSLVGRNGGDPASLTNGVRIQGGSLTVRDGQLGIASVLSDLELTLDMLEPLPNINGDMNDQLGGISLSKAAEVSTIGASANGVVVKGGSLALGEETRISTTASLTGNDKGADIFIDVDTLSLTDMSMITTTGGESTPGGDITVNVSSELSSTFSFILTNSVGSGKAGDITITGSSSDVSLSGLSSIISGAAGLGGPGKITVDVGKLTLNGSIIGSNSSASGPGSTVNVNVAEAFTISGRPELGLPSGLGSIVVDGDPGELVVKTPNLLIQNGAIGALSSQNLGTNSRAGNITLEVETLTAINGSFIDSSTGTTGKAGDIVIRGLAGETTNARLVELGTSSRIRAETTAQGDGGAITVQVDTLRLTGGAQIDSSTRGDGKGGNLTVKATDSIMISGVNDAGFRSGLFNNTSGPGDAGELLSVSTSALIMDDGRIVTRSLGDGNAGKIDVDVDTLQLLNGAQIFSGIGSIENGQVVGTDGPGKGGRISIDAENSILITGSSSNGFSSGIFGNNQIGTGNGGDLQVSTATLNITGAGQISAVAGELSTGNAGNLQIEVNESMLSNGATINSSTFGQGQGGTISLVAIDRATFSGPGTSVSATAANEGRGGDIQISTTKELTIRDGASISASSLQLGDAGTVLIQSGDSIIVDNSAITTRAENSSGGSIKLTAEDLIRLSRSTIESLVRGGEDTTAGNISLDPEFIIVQDSQILAQATSGAGGNIELIGNTVLVDPNSTIDASSQFGISGSVNIQAPIQNLSGAIAPLPETIIEAATLYGARCAAQKGSEFSSLSVRGRDRIPFEPGDYLSTPMLPDNMRGAVSKETAASRMARRLELTAWGSEAGTLSAAIEARIRTWNGGCGL